MKVITYSRTQAEHEQYTGSEKVWISINDEDYDSPIKRFDKLLIQKYDDVAPFHVEIEALHPYYRQAFKKREPVYFDERMADDVISIGLHCAITMQDVHIHCFAGKSRSVATAQALNEIFNLYYLDNRESYRENMERITRSCPNSFVYAQIMKRFFERKEEIESNFAKVGMLHRIRC